MKIIYETPEGGVAVVSPAPDIDIDQLASKVVPSGASWDAVENSVIPTDTTFRNAWEKSGATVVENLVKAKVIATEQVKAAYKKEMRAVADAALFDEPIARPADDIKATYRDVVAQIDNANSLAELSSLIA